MKLSNWPFFDSDEIQKVSNCLISGKVNYWTGDEGKLFESEFSEFIGTNYSIAMANGTLALNAAYSSLGLSEGDEFITTPRTFLATSTAGIELGAKPIFADVEKRSGCISADTIEPLITKNTKLISVVHLAGWPADMEKIMNLANSYNLKVVEDCSQAHGASINDKSVGGFGHVSTWSFCQDKIISTGGEGGMVSTDSRKLWDYMWSLKDHGKSWDKVYKASHAEGFRWLHESLGSNFRLSNLQSAIGRCQIRKLNNWHEIRKRNSKILIETLKDLSLLRLETPDEEYEHAWYKFYCYLYPERLSDGWSRDKIVYEINQAGYPAFHGGCSEIYLEEFFIRNNLSPKVRLKVAKELGETSLMFLVHPTITLEQMTEYADVIRSIIYRSCK